MKNLIIIEPMLSDYLNLQTNEKQKTEFILTADSCSNMWILLSAQSQLKTIDKYVLARISIFRVP